MAAYQQSGIVLSLGGMGKGRYCVAYAPELFVNGEALPVWTPCQDLLLGKLCWPSTEEDFFVVFSHYGRYWLGIVMKVSIWASIARLRPPKHMIKRPCGSSLALLP